jgi:hypothetical protein
MLPKIAIRPQQSSRHVHDDFFALLWADRFGAHLRVFVVLAPGYLGADRIADRGFLEIEINERYPKTFLLGA